MARSRYSSVCSGFAAQSGSIGASSSNMDVDSATGTSVGLRLLGVGRTFGETVAVSGVDLEVPRQGRVSIVGPSGCGKSTLLAMMCGLEEPDEGSISVLGAI